MPPPALPSRAQPAERVRATLTRLRRPGEAPVRLLVVAETDAVDPLSDGRAPLLLDVLDRLWLRLRRGVEVDVLHQPAAALAAMARTPETRSADHDLVVILLTDPGTIGRVGARRSRLLLRGLQHLTASAPALLVLPAGAPPPEGIAAPLDGPPQPGGTAAPLEVLHAPLDEPASADALAEHLQGVLDVHAPVPGAAPVGGAPADQPRLPARLERRLAQITRIARDAFGTDTAAVNISARQQLHTIAADGGDRGSQPQTGSLCDLTITHNGLVVITDTLALPSLQPYRALHVPEPVRFYAGYPISDPDGAPRGALCVYDRAPREQEEFDFTLLRDLALLAEGELAQAELPRARDVASRPARTVAPA